ncbi:phenylalanine--tRNA ligase subunit beta [Candidatus Dependentiae bacterium]
MKISLSWTFDHINGDWRDVDVEKLLSEFNRKTAEIESVENWSWKSKDIAAASVVEVLGDGIKVNIPEWGIESVLELRETFGDSDEAFLVCRDKEKVRWASFEDFGIKEREGFFPPLKIEAGDLAGKWKNDLETDDIIFEVDNKSITHRPDMWGHRGFAREIAMILDLPLKSERDVTESIEVVEHGVKCSGSQIPLKITNNVPYECSRFCGAHFTNVSNVPSIPKMAFKLIRLGAKPINALVDMTNFLMFDWGQSVHAYDADAVPGNHFVINMAKGGEKLGLLDDTEIELTKYDIVIASEKEPMALAGVMGGKKHSIGQKTSDILLESATFEATVIRKSAAHHKIRTEASARFEKTPTSVQAATAIMRMVKIAKEYGITLNLDGQIHAVGELPEILNVEVRHSFLESRSGEKLSCEKVRKILEKLEFSLVEKALKDDVIYKISVPPFRASKDIRIKEDILEEIVRCYGLDNIPQEIPKIGTGGVDLTSRLRMRSLKRYLTHGARMMEQFNYAFIDEVFAKKIGYEPENTLNISNPVSEQASRMTTTLMPHLLKNVFDNYAQVDDLSFFEFGRKWVKNSKSFEEQKVVAGIAFSKRKNVDFYEWKNRVNEVFSIAGIKNVKWDKPQDHPHLWIHPYQSAELSVLGKNVGIVGKIDASVWSTLDFLPESDAFIFELDAQFLLEYVEDICQYRAISKFQESSFDLSMMIPISVTSQTLECAVRDSNAAIRSVKLIDFFEKKDWVDKRSLAFHVVCGNDKRSLSKDEVSQIREEAIRAVEKHGAKLREL